MKDIIIRLTDIGGKEIFINKNKIIHFNYVDEKNSWNRESYTQMLLENCSLQVKETCDDIYILCNK